MTHLFLDTSAYSAFKRGHPRALELVRAADEISLNTIVLGELLAGFDAGRFRDANRRELQAFLSHQCVVALPLTRETAERYSCISLHLRQHGTPVPTNDLWIAASVMETGSVLVTADRHFLRIPQIQTELLDVE